MTTPRWYMVNKDGMATLCTDQADAEKEAADAQSVWPHMGPHRAVQLVVASFEAADMAAAAARGFRDGVGHVQNPAENEHVAGDVSKNEAELNMSTQQPAPATQQAGEKCPSCRNGDLYACTCPFPTSRNATTAQAAESVPAVDRSVMEMAESVGLIGPASRTRDLHAAIQRFHDLICVNATIKAAQMAAEVISKPAPQQEAQEPAAVVVPCHTPSGKRVALYSAKQDLPIGTQLYTAPQPSPAAQGDALSDDAVRVPLDSLHADAAYLIGRLREGSMSYARVIEIIRERIDAAKAAIRARAAQEGK